MSVCEYTHIHAVMASGLVVVSGPSSINGVGRSLEGFVCIENAQTKITALP